MNYPGGKNAGGSYQRIINQIPPHVVYIEPFAGSAPVRRMMRPSARSVLIDLDPKAIGSLAAVVPPGTELLTSDGIAWLLARERSLTDPAGNPATVVYADPPYLPSACRSPIRYRHALTDQDHRGLLKLLGRLRCYVLLSGYASPLYTEALAGWRLVTWPAMTRGGTMAQEHLWCNFSEPTALHDYRYLGATFRERQDIRRQQDRWRRRLAAMDITKRRALLAAIAAEHLTGTPADGVLLDRPAARPPSQAATRRRSA